MSDGVYYDPIMTQMLIPRWGTQASQMRTAASTLASVSASGLPSAAQGAAQAFLEMWESSARTAAVASEVYADELASTHGSYMDFDAEIARRMEALGAR